MPEGDTVWLTAQRLHGALAGRPLTVSDFRVPALATVDLRRRTMTEVLARGKHLLMRLDDGLTVHSHLRMDGSWRLSATGSGPSRRFPAYEIRVLLGNTEWLATGYRVHDLSIVAREREAELVGHLGPDLLGPDWDAARAVRNLAGQPETGIGAALLDQRNLAGMGTVYVTETLFIEGVHPATAIGQVAALEKVVGTARRLLHMNRDHPEQSTTGLMRRGSEHWAYGRAGQPCRRCRTPIARGQFGPPGRARQLFWCPTCQPGPSG